ncbi:SDR family NAD(P)-dependent oxidoreductase [Paenibacillus koleovorans]|uniref:SDR family NAD(P)-dependent oxidoreductase n=1 Tax=Paenibacillus koleovorans TaxID=121608 RepID=UPI0013E37F08|nr:3-oxoacyl-ACP reductase family protein [Paenibacillus koleovorans]
MALARFEGKIVLITGADGGIGKTTAERFSEEGAVIAAASNNAERLAELEREFTDRGRPILTLTTDVSDPGQVAEAVRRTVESFGRIDVLVNNAGIAWEEDFLEITPEHWRRMLDVNLNGMFFVAQETAKQMVRQGEGVILNMASTNGLVGEAKYAHYNASKGGVVLLTKTMAIELGASNIRVNAVCPGYIQTQMSEAIDDPAFVAEYIRTKIPLGRVGKAKDVAGVFAFLASEDAAFITGETIVVDGGQLTF